MGIIILVFLSEIDNHIIDRLKQNLEKTFAREVVVRLRTQNLAYAFDARRKQYKSPRLLSRLRRLKKDPDDKILGITDVDLYSPGYDFVYGEAEMSSGIATLSLYRLKSRRPGTTPDSQIFQRRIAREATHELSHLYDLGHCENRKCVRLHLRNEVINQVIGLPRCHQDLEKNLVRA
jgi:archaemetzincin